MSFKAGKEANTLTGDVRTPDNTLGGYSPIRTNFEKILTFGQFQTGQNWAKLGV
jgi:hypothetical protein